MLKKMILFIVLSLILFSPFSFVINAFDLDDSKADVDGYYAYNLEKKLTLVSENIDALIFPSSTVKMMTACIALESGISSEKVVTVNSKMIEDVTGRNMALKVGDKITFGDLLYAMICAGYNDAAHVIAHTVSHSIDDFLILMNEKAKSLGMGSTNYLNVTGMYTPGMHTTVSDIAILAKYLSQNDRFVEISSTRTYIVSSDATTDYRTIKNRSSLMAAYKGLANFNTGSADHGDCAVLYYKVDDLSFIFIVMNASPKDKDDTTNYAETYSKRLISHALNDYSVKTVMDTKTLITSLPVKYSISDEAIGVYLKNDLRLYLPEEIDLENGLDYSVNIHGGELKAPLKEGDVVGELVVSLDGAILSVEPLVVNENIDRNAFLFIMDLMKEYVTGRLFLLTVIIFIIAMVGYYCTRRSKLKRMYRRQKNSTSHKKNRR